MVTRLFQAVLGFCVASRIVQSFAPFSSKARKLCTNDYASTLSVLSNAERTKEKKQEVVDLNKLDNAWEVHKFGGASLATSDLYRTVGDLLIKEANGRGEGAIPTMAVVSARGGMTDLLVSVVDSAVHNFEDATSILEDAVQSQISLLNELAPPEITAPIEIRFRQDAKDILSIVQSLKMIRTVPAVTMEVVTGFGEIWSAQTLYAYLKTQGVPCEWIDAREVLVVKSDSSGLGEKGEASTGGVVPLWDQTASRMKNWWNTVGKENGFFDIDYKTNAPILVVTGFVAATADGVPTTLKRSGSDYSATLFAKLIGAGRVTMWKNTNGVYTADPRRVPEAFPIASLKYDEAMELAYFGAQVLHPSAMVPCIDDSIPVYVRNIFNPSFEGTVIEGRSPSLKEVAESGTRNWRSKEGEVPIKGITSVDKISLITLEGASVMGGGKAAERFMGAMADNDITVLIITQASSESSICVAVPENQGTKALAAIQDAFELELSRSRVSSVSLIADMSIVAIVGEGMAMNSGVSATFMSSLARAGVNIRVIAQGSSERQVAVVVDANDTSRALRAAHMAFTLSETVASVAVLGCTGTLGSTFMKQVDGQKQRLKEEQKIAVCVNVAASSSKLLICKDANGIDTQNIDELLESKDSQDLDIDKVSEAMEADVNPHRVIIDCTNSEAVAQNYERWLSNGINIISPNRNMAAGPLEVYRKVKKVQRDNNVDWLYECGVGASLPILSTLRDIQETGDTVNVIRGCISGTFAYVFNTISDNVSFSEAVKQAVEQSFCENDVREDLSGLDAAKKVVILARNIDMDVNIEDVEIESLIPDDLMNKKYDKDKSTLNLDILEDLQTLDGSIMERVKAAESDDRVLRYKFVIDKNAGTCKCRLEAVDRTDPLFRLRPNENLVAFETDRYTTSPLIVKGAAAGPDLAAGGMFSDLLRLTRAFSSLQV